MFLDPADLQRSFDPQTLARARGYLVPNRVTNVRLSEQHDAASANVQGSGTRPYAVRIAVRDRDGVRTIESDCSCSDGRACKHGAALALLLSDNERGASSASDRAVDTWSRQMIEVYGDVSADETIERLLYVIDLPEAQGLHALQLVPYVMPPAGSNAEPREFSLYNLGIRVRVSSPVPTASQDVLSARADCSDSAPTFHRRFSRCCSSCLRRAGCCVGKIRRHRCSRMCRSPRANSRGAPTMMGSCACISREYADAVLLPTAPLWYVDLAAFVPDRSRSPLRRSLQPQ